MTNEQKYGVGLNKFLSILYRLKVTKSHFGFIYTPPYYVSNDIQRKDN
jgi:hypothetical protein